MWRVILRDGSEFLGKRTLLAVLWYEGWAEKAFKVVNSAKYQEGSYIIVPRRSIVCMVKEAK